jgi:hypothetical protein
MAAQFKMATKIWFTSETYKPSFLSNLFFLPYRLSKYLTFTYFFFLQNSRWRPYPIWRFLSSFSRSSGHRQTLQKAKTTIHILQKKNQGCFSCLFLRKKMFSKIQDSAICSYELSNSSGILKWENFCIFLKKKLKKKKKCCKKFNSKWRPN